MYTYQTKIKLHETDAAGTLFFADQYKLIHDAFESFMEGMGFSIADMIQTKDFLLPIVHSEADHKLPLHAGEPIEIRVTVANIGKTSFTLSYKLLNATKNSPGTAQTVHVSVDKQTRKKIPLPSDLHARLEELQSKN